MSIRNVSSFVLLVLAVAASVAAADPKTVVDFSTVPYPDFHLITCEYAAQGICFSDDDRGLPPGYVSLRGQQNIAFEQGMFNPFMILFSEEVKRVTVTLEDRNLGGQTHYLTAFDTQMQIVDSDAFTEAGLSDDFELEVKGKAISFIVLQTSPLGAQKLLSVEYKTK